MAKKMPRRMVALSSSAIAAIYFVGLLSTATAAAPTASTAPTTTVGASASASASSSDGTYTGTGSGRFGSVTVAVTMLAGRITNVQITRVATTFPVSQIASLLAHVVTTHTAPVNAA